MEPAATRPNASGQVSGQYNVNNSGNPSRIGPFYRLMANGTYVLQGITLDKRKVGLRPDLVPILPRPATDSRIPVPSNTYFTPTRRQQQEYPPQVSDSYLEYKPECSIIYNAKQSELTYPVPWLLDPSKDEEKECPLSVAIRQPANPSSNQQEYADYQQLHTVIIPELMKIAGKRGNESWRVQMAGWVNCQDEYGYTPLMNAARHGVLSCIELLIDAGATPLWERGSTALHEALSEDKHSWGGTRYEVLKTMLSALKKKAPVPLAELVNKKLSPLKAGSFKKILTEMKERLPSENTVLHQLLRRGNGIGTEEVIKLAKLLLEFGADPMVENGEGKTVFEYAYSERDKEHQDIIVQAIVNNMPVNRLEHILAQPNVMPFKLTMMINFLINRRILANIDGVQSQASASVPFVSQRQETSRGQHGQSQYPLTRRPVQTTGRWLPLPVVEQVEQYRCFPVGGMAGSHTVSDVPDAVGTAEATSHSLSTMPFDDYDSSRYLETMNDIGEPVIAQELITLLGDFLEQIPTDINQPSELSVPDNINSWNDQSVPSTTADSNIKTEPLASLFTQVEKSEGAFDEPLIVDPWVAVATGQPLTDYESMPSCSTPWVESKASTTPISDANSSGSAISSSDKGSDSESFYIDRDSCSEVSISENNSFSDMANIYHGQLTERQTMIQASGLSQQWDNVSDPVRPTIEIQSHPNICLWCHR